MGELGGVYYIGGSMCEQGEVGGPCAGRGTVQLGGAMPAHWGPARHGGAGCTHAMGQHSGVGAVCMQGGSSAGVGGVHWGQPSLPPTLVPPTHLGATSPVPCVPAGAEAGLPPAGPHEGRKRPLGWDG